MSIKLDWDIEAETGKHREHREDSKERRQRYLGFLRLILVIVVFLSLIGIALYVIAQRLEQVNSHVRQLLVETVEAEVASLRIGDFQTFINIQRSATDDWYITQEAAYNSYQTLKAESSVILSGRVLDATVDNLRGRVQVEELIDGVPYVQTWFYWRYDDGWRHVPPDYTFWGESQTLRSGRVEIRYRGVDARLAEEVKSAVDRWLDTVCTGLIDCQGLPTFTIDIIPDPLLQTLWANNEQGAWQMVMPSPYTTRARYDFPFTRQLQIDVAALLAGRLVLLSTGTAPTAPDANYLQEAVVRWLTGQFVQVNSESYLIESLVANYGLGSLRTLLANLSGAADIGVVATVTGGSLADANLDWRDFVAARLTLEDELIRAGDEANWQRLYDLRDPNLVTTAYSRYNAGVAQQERHVLSVARMIAPDGTPQLQAQVQVNSGTETTVRTILFTLINGNWLRAN